MVQSIQKGERNYALALLKNGKLLQLFDKVAQHNKESSDPRRGQNLFKGGSDVQELGVNYLTMLLELIEFCAQKYPKLSSNKPTQFTTIYQTLKQNGVTFPKQYSHLPQPGQKSTQQQESNRADPTPQPPSQSQSQKQSQSQTQSQNQNQSQTQQKESAIEFKKKIDNFIGEAEKDLEDIIKVLNETKSTDSESRDLIEGFMNFSYEYITNIEEQIESIKKRKSPNPIPQDDQDYLESMKQFLEDLYADYQQWVVNGYIDDYYKQFRNRSLKRAIAFTDLKLDIDEEEKPPKKETVKKPDPQPEPKPKQEVKNEGFDKWETGQSGGFQSSGANQRNIAESQFSNFESQHTEHQQFSQQQQKYKETQQKKVTFDNPYNQNQVTESERRQKEKEEQEKKDRKIAEDLMKGQDSGQDKKKTGFGSLFNDIQSNKQGKSTHVQPQAQQQYSSALNANQHNNKQSQPIHSKPQYRSEIQVVQPSNNLQQMNVDDIDEANNFQLSQQQQNAQVANNNYDPSRPPTRYQQYQERKMEAFDEQFSMASMSAASATSQDFPLKNKEIYDQTIYEGREISYDRTIQNLVESSKINPSMIRKLKVANLKHKSLLIDNQEVQFGIKTELIFDYMTSKNHLLVHLFIGNKSPNPIQNIRVDYFGDHTCELWKRQKNEVDDRLDTGKQIKQEFIIQYKNCPYDIISGEFFALVNNHKNVGQKFFIPMLLTKFMTFKQTDPFVFKSKWELKKDQIIKSEIFTVNTRVIRSPTDFLKFFKKSIEFSSFQDFLSQKNQKQGDILRTYQLGGIFELNTPHIEFFTQNNCETQFDWNNINNSLLFLCQGS